MIAFAIMMLLIVFMVTTLLLVPPEHVVLSTTVLTGFTLFAIIGILSLMKIYS